MTHVAKMNDVQEHQWFADKSIDHIERYHQDCTRSEKIYCGLINFKSNDIVTSPQVKLKSEQIKNESKRNLKRKR